MLVERLGLLKTSVPLNVEVLEIAEISGPVCLKCVFIFDQATECILVVLVMLFIYSFAGAVSVGNNVIFQKLRN